MNTRNRLAFACIAIAALSELGLGLVYLTASEVMPYHKEALGVGWSELEPGVRVMLLTIIRGYGSAHLSAGIALAVLLLFPLSRGQAWALLAILAVGLPILGATAWLSTRLAATTGANVPWQGAIALLVLFVIGVAFADPKAAARAAGPS
jgi:hypothetical protein